jgi:UDP-N-acetylglucosamine:LPS N-acetylglucosamine transferase
MRLVISAGGTGGHIFPGIAVAEALMGRATDNSVLFIGTPYGLEGRSSPMPGSGSASSRRTSSWDAPRSTRRSPS